jgi:hypothetical protein
VRELIPALGFSAMAVALSVGITMAAPARGEMAVAFSPFTSESTAWAIIHEAGGLMVAPTRLPNVVVVYAADTEFQQRARTLGALFFLKATGLCAPETRPETT